ncbi:MAG: GNAT family protein [Bdellovibrionota bacterium]
MTLFDPVLIEGKRVTIRTLAAVDWKDLAHALLYEGSFHERAFGINTPEKFKTRYDAALANIQNRKGQGLVFLSKDESEIYGMTNFMNCEPENKMTEIGGTWIAKKWQRTFVNTESKYLLLKYCFEVLKLKRVEFRVMIENIPSQVAMKRLGIRLEGILRNRRILPNGESKDYHFYAAIDRDWPTLKPELEILLAKY